MKHERDSKSLQVKYEQRKAVWQSQLQDPKEITVFEALSNPKWDWRSPKSITEETGLNDTEVVKIIKAHQSLTRRWPSLTRDNRELYALIGTPTTLRERLAIIRAYFTKGLY